MNQMLAFARGLLRIGEAMSVGEPTTDGVHQCLYKSTASVLPLLLLCVAQATPVAEWSNSATIREPGLIAFFA